MFLYMQCVLQHELFVCLTFSNPFTSYATHHIPIAMSKDTNVHIMAMCKAMAMIVSMC